MDGLVCINPAFNGVADDRCEVLTCNIVRITVETYWQLRRLQRHSSSASDPIEETPAAIAIHGIPEVIVRLEQDSTRRFYPPQSHLSHNQMAWHRGAEHNGSRALARSTRQFAHLPSCVDKDAGIASFWGISSLAVDRGGRSVTGSL